jgi:pyruvate formate lyase activating enzyme
VVFTQGCNFNCVYCHNPETISREISPPAEILEPREVMARIEPSLPFIRGITVSGGECTLYPDFLRSLGKLVKAASLSYFLDSNGSYDFEKDGELTGIIDGVMLDIKANPLDREEYRKVSGGGGRILELAEFLAPAGKLWEVRTVVSPGLFDAARVVETVCRRLAPVWPDARYKLIRYRPNGVREQAAAALQRPGDALMDELAAICAANGVKAVII